MKTIKVKELKKGDELGGCTVVETPILIGDYQSTLLLIAFDF